MSKPLISVVIPAYNAAAYLPETLASVRAQTFSNYELIVVDDGSDDATCEIASQFGARCLQQAKRGAAAARNTGIRAACGEFVAFLDADDIWMPTKLTRQTDWFRAHSGAVWVYTDAVVFNSASGRVICRIGDRLDLGEGYILRPLLERSFIPSATPVVRREALFAAGLFDEARERRIGEDWSLWLRLAERYPAGLIREPLARIRRREDSTSLSADALEAYRSERSILSEALARNPACRDLAGRAMGAISASAGLRCLRRGRAINAARLFVEMLKLRWIGSGI